MSLAPLFVGRRLPGRRDDNGCLADADWHRQKHETKKGDEDLTIRSAAGRSALIDMSTPPNPENKFLRHPVVRVLWSLIGAAGGTALGLALAGPSVTPFLLASLGGTAVFLFGMTRAPAAQPRALFGGHLAGAMVGIACYQSFGESLSVYVLALVLTLAVMLITRTVHPPAGANPILMIYVHAGWSALFQPVLVGILALTAVAFAWSRLYPGLAHYPQAPMTPSPPRLDWGGWADTDDS